LSRIYVFSPTQYAQGLEGASKKKKKGKTVGREPPGARWNVAEKSLAKKKEKKKKKCH